MNTAISEMAQTAESGLPKSEFMGPGFRRDDSYFPTSLSNSVVVIGGEHKKPW